MSRRSKRSGGEEFIGGATLIAVFGLLFVSTHQSFWLFPLCFAGIPPLLRGIQRIYAKRALERTRQEALPQTPAPDATKEILKVAQSNKGKVTPAIVTLNSTLSLEEAERLLQELTSKGYASMNVTDSGRIEYEFPEFMDEPGKIE
ncbi:MAG TPA: hypothetical protein VMW69_09100 [Spirochaetia bacterium]|nr:hypothetical protein [Spirochaetia bacterium]